MSRRSDLYPLIVQMRAEGLLWREVAEALGISRSLAHEYGTDPDGSKVYQRKRKRRCVDCGTRIHSDTKRLPQQRCSPCARTNSTRQCHERCIERMQAWALRFGQPPSAADWSNCEYTRVRHPAAARRQALAADEWWPASSVVVRSFGSWSAGIAAAGFAPLASGHKRKSPTPTRGTYDP